MKKGFCFFPLPTISHHPIKLFNGKDVFGSTSEHQTKYVFSLDDSYRTKLSQVLWHCDFQRQHNAVSTLAGVCCATGEPSATRLSQTAHFYPSDTHKSSMKLHPLLILCILILPVSFPPLFIT